MPTAPAPLGRMSRPIGLTLVVVLAWLNAIGDVIGGIVNGSGWARTLVAALMALQIVTALYALTQVSWENQRSHAVSALAQIAIAALILYVLYNRRSDRYFATSR